MSRMCIATRGPLDWKSRLADPEKHWKCGHSAKEAAISWESAAHTKSGVPKPIAKLLNPLGEPELLLAVAEHKVKLHGQGPASACDIWALVKTNTAGTISLAVEAKAGEPFGEHLLDDWLNAGKGDGSQANRKKRWKHICETLSLEATRAERDFKRVKYQLLHRCAAAVLEAKRFGLVYAACFVQAFPANNDHFQEYHDFCAAMGLSNVIRNKAYEVTLSSTFRLLIGWTSTERATDKQIAWLNPLKD